MSRDLPGRFRRPLFGTLLVVCVSSPALVATIYVDNGLQSDCSGDTCSIDAHACSGHDGAAYRIIQSAVIAMNPGDTVLLRSRTYHKTHDDSAYLSFEMTGNLNCQDPSPLVLGNFDVSRNLFYESTDSETVVRFSNVEYTPAQLSNTDAADLV